MVQSSMMFSFHNAQEIHNGILVHNECYSWMCLSSAETCIYI